MYLASPIIQNLIEEIEVGATREALTKAKIERFDISVPSFEQQLQVVATVDKLLALVATLEKQQKERDRLSEYFAQAVVATLTGTQIEERKEKMKAPKTELISNLSLGTKHLPAAAAAPLTGLLLKAERHELPAKLLWQQSGLTIDDFYQQLKTELAHGWIASPKVAEMTIVDENAPHEPQRHDPTPGERRIDLDL